MIEPSTNLATLVVSDDDLGKRLDVFIAEKITGHSRTTIKRWIENGHVKLDEGAAKASTALRVGQTIHVDLQASLDMVFEEDPGEDIPLDVIFEDDHIAAVNKPAGMVVHPAKGNWKGTLTAALKFRYQQLSTLGGEGRPGIIHRLDRDTSGVILVAKTDLAHMKLTKQFEKRTVGKRYLAVVTPPPERDRDEIDAPIGPHPYQREKMAIRPDRETGKPANSFYEVIERHGRFAFVHVFPKTGRTHQIRIHLAHIGSPVLADRQYSGRSRISEGWIQTGQDDGQWLIERQALHAESINFKHPADGKEMSISAPIAEDIEKLMRFVRNPKS